MDNHSTNRARELRHDRTRVELDGGHHAKTVEYDAGRTEVLEHAGLHLLRV